MLKRLLRPKTQQAIADSSEARQIDAGAKTTRTADVEAKHLIDVVAAVDAYNAAGRFVDALAAVDHALATAPDDLPLLIARGSTLYEWGRYREARQAFLKAHARGSHDPDLPLKIGWSCITTGLRVE